MSRASQVRETSYRSIRPYVIYRFLPFLITLKWLLTQI